MLPQLIYWVTEIATILIIIRALLSWVPNISARNNDFVRLLDSLTEPLLRPFRQLIPPRATGGIDLSPILAILALWVIRTILISLLV